jgi:hypothetical protein
LRYERHRSFYRSLGDADRKEASTMNEGAQLLIYFVGMIMLGIGIGKWLKWRDR